MNSYISPSKDFLWKRFFEDEFLMLDFPDHKRKAEETYYEYFKRSFVDYYQRFRFLLKSIVYQTNQASADVYKQGSNYIKSFRDRKPHKLILEVMGIEDNGILLPDAKISFQYMCFYKNWNDP